MPANSGYTLSIECILREAKFRWLKGYEVLCILQNYQQYGLQLSPAAPVEPQSGSLFLFNKRLVKFRKDGVNWRKQKDGKTVRESHEKLKVGGIKVLSCCYTRSAENLTFQRRIYWLLDGDPTTVLVHYLTLDKEMTGKEEGGMFDPSTLDEYDAHESKLRRYHLHNDNNEDERDTPSGSDFSGDEEGEYSMKNGLDSSATSLSGSYPPVNETLMDFVNSLISPHENISQSTHKYAPPPYAPVAGETLDIANKDASMCGKLAKLTDFSPEWDYVEGGTKILIMSPDFHNGLNYFCMFDQLEVPAELVQDGVIRCRAPPHYKPGFVSFCVTRGNFMLFSEVYHFEFKVRDAPSDLLTMNERSFKLRIIERLERLEREVNSASAMESISLSDNIMESLTSTLEDKCLSEEQLEQVFVKILASLMKGLDNTDTINSQDRDGFTLLHYACALRYHILASTLIQYGANVNIQDKSGNTPFHWAMKNKDQKMIKTLVDYIDLNKNAYNQFSEFNFSPKPAAKSSMVEGITHGMDELGLQLEEGASSPCPANFKKLKEREGSVHSSPRTPHLGVKSRQVVRPKESNEEDEAATTIQTAFKTYRAKRVEKSRR